MPTSCSAGSIRIACSRSSTRSRWTRSAPRSLERSASRSASTPAAAAAIVRVANDRMAGAMRMVSLARGHDPRDFALFAFGGAGPLHAAALARELGNPEVLIPARPGLTNALGCVVADLRHDFVATVNQPLEALAEAASARSSRSKSRAAGRCCRENSPSSTSSTCTAPACSSRARATSCRCDRLGGDHPRRVARDVLGGLLEALRRRAAGDPAGAGQPAHAR